MRFITRFCGNRLIPWARIVATPARPPSGSAAGQPVTAREGVLHLHAWTLVVVRVQVRCRAHRHPRIRDHRAPDPGPRLDNGTAILRRTAVERRHRSPKLTPPQSPSGDMMEYAMAPHRQLSARFTSCATAPSARCEARQRRELCTGGSGRRRRRRRRRRAQRVVGGRPRRVAARIRDQPRRTEAPPPEDVMVA